MGRPKAWLPFGPERMLQRVVRLLGSVVQPLVVVAADRQRLPQLPAHIVVARDRRPSRGPLEGISVGLRALPAGIQAAYITSCDAPLLVPECVQAIVAQLAGYDVAVPHDGSRYHPLAAAYRTGVWPQADRLLQADRLRPAFLFDRVPTREVPVAELRAVDPELRTLMNVNCPQDYAAALERAGLPLPTARPT